jgi:hypothetical protein
MKPEERASISVSKQTHAAFTNYCAQLTVKTGESQTQDSAILSLLEIANNAAQPAQAPSEVTKRFFIVMTVTLWLAVLVIGTLFAAHVLL